MELQASAYIYIYVLLNWKAVNYSLDTSQWITQLDAAYSCSSGGGLVRSGAGKWDAHKLSIHQTKFWETAAFGVLQNLWEVQGPPWRHKICRRLNFLRTFFFTQHRGIPLIYLIDWIIQNKCLSPPEGWISACFFPKMWWLPLTPSFITLLAHLRILSLEVNPLIAEREKKKIP